MSHEAVSEFYGQTVSKTEDLIFDACCITDYERELLEPLTDEVLERRYGCGSPIPPLLDGLTVLDLGSGAGIDCFIAAQLVGEGGRVIGVDMTDEQLAIARRNVEPIMSNLGYGAPNVEFAKGRIEALPVDDDSVDVVISNCVINLAPDKAPVFAEIQRVLRPGGEFYIADIVADRRIPEHLASDARLYSECLTGAAYRGDLVRTMRDAGFADVRTVKDQRLDTVIEGIHFASVILRGFAIELEDQCEDYGQVAVYRGTVPRHEARFELDSGHVFEAGTPMRVCKNTADMLTQTRYARHFAVSEPILHLGPFDCSPEAPSDSVHTGAPVVSSETTSSGGSCC